MWDKEENLMYWGDIIYNESYIDDDNELDDEFHGEEQLSIYILK